MSRRDLFRLATVAVGTLIALVLAVPGVAYVVSPLRKKGEEQSFETLTRLKQLEVGVPRSFAIIKERHDAWVKYPREPVGSVWLIRQPAGSRSAGDRVHVGMPAPGLRGQSLGRQEGVSVPLPHQLHSTSTGSPRTRFRRGRWIGSRSSWPPATIPRSASSFSGSAPRARRRSPLLKQLADWLDDRTGYRDLMQEALDEPIPGGVRWRYVFGSALSVIFMVQVFTGLL